MGASITATKEITRMARWRKGKYTIDSRRRQMAALAQRESDKGKNAGLG
jgi:hypothetical protein